MDAFSLHPNVYASGEPTGLLRMCEEVWVRGTEPGHGVFYVVSGYGRFNGGVRFFEVFRHHVAAGGEVRCVFAGSANQNLTSMQVVQELLDAGAQVAIVNRKRPLHAKCYGSSAEVGDRLIVTSGNFTGPGMSQNVEAAILLGEESTRSLGFSWPTMMEGIFSQGWDIYEPSLEEMDGPAWGLLFDEITYEPSLPSGDDVTLLLTLGHSDTARIQADPGTDAAKGTQYFWLSKDHYDFFPPLTIRNQRGHKTTYSCIVTIHYMDIEVTDHDCRVTFEAENNLDFRLGTGALRFTEIAEEGDMAALSRVGDSEYELRVLPEGSPNFNALLPWAIRPVGHRGKRCGFIDNERLAELIGVSVPADEVVLGFEEVS